MALHMWVERDTREACHINETQYCQVSGRHAQSHVHVNVHVLVHVHLCMNMYICD